MNTVVLGKVNNTSHISKDINIPIATFILGAAAVGTYVGFRIGGAIGAAVGALIGAFVGTLSVGLIKLFKVHLLPDGTVEVMYETRF